MDTRPELVVDPAQEDAFQLLFRSSPQPMWIYDLQTLRFLEVNDAAIALYGYDRDAFLAMRITDIRPEEHLDRLARNLEKPRPPLEATGRWRHIVRDGALIDVEITSHTIDYGGTPSALVLIRDLTLEVRAQESIRQLEERFARVFRDSPAALVISRLSDGHLMNVNRSYEALLGWSRDELIGHLPSEFDLYDDTEARKKMVQGIHETGSVRDLPVQMRTKSGELLDILASMEAVELDGEECILSVVTDVTEHLAAQRALEQREREMSFLAEAGAILGSSLEYERTLRSVAELAVPHIADWCAVHILDEDDAVRELAVAHADPARVKLAHELQSRYPPEPGRESGILRVAHSGEPVIWSEISDEMLAASARDEEHLALMRELGFCSIIIVPLIARDRALGALTLVSGESGRRFGDHDVALAQLLARRAAMAVDNARLFAERTAAEEALRALNTELEQRVQARTIELEAANAELEAFAYSVSHDLRAPLRSVDGFAGVLADRYGDTFDERGLRYLKHVRAAAQEMGELIDALLRLARLTRSEMHRSRVNLSEIARAIVDSLMEEQPERDVQPAIEEDLVADGDPHLLRALLENLIGNAWKFSRGRSPATIAFGAQAGTAEAGPYGGERVYFVRDNGAGFDPRYAHKLFGPFQRLHSAAEFEGSGIGLATVQRIVRRHGGRVWAKGQVGEGATFYFTLAPEVAASRVGTQWEDE